MKKVRFVLRSWVRLVRLGTLTNLTFFIVLQFEIFLRLDNFSSSFLFQRVGSGHRKLNISIWVPPIYVHPPKDRLLIYGT